MDLHGRVPDRSREPRYLRTTLRSAAGPHRRESEECRKVLTPLDQARFARGTVTEAGTSDPDTLPMTMRCSPSSESKPTATEYYRAAPCSVERRKADASEEIASRTRCRDFEQFRPLFEQAQREIEEGIRIDTTLRAQRPRSNPVGSSSWGGRRRTSHRWGRVFTQEVR